MNAAQNPAGRADRVVAERVVVVGFGPVASRLIDDLLPAVRAGTVSLTVIGAETVPAYNRVLVADLGVGRTSEESMEMSDPGELAAAGVNVRTGRRVTHIDRSRRLVRMDDGSAEPFDRLVLCTGARATVPNLNGLNPDPAAVHVRPGVTALRDLTDAGRLHRAVRHRQHIVVLGAGILGLEAALAAAEEGATVTVVYHGAYPLGRNLDRLGGAVLAATLRSRGIHLIPQARSTGVTFAHSSGGQFTSLVLEDGGEIAGDLLLLSCGVRPRTELAAGCGLEVSQGIRVNHHLAADLEERIFAIGDCAQVACRDPGCSSCPSDGGSGPSGLIAPGWRQASWLAEYLSKLGDRTYGPSLRVGPRPLEAEKLPVMLLKARGLDLAAAGSVDLDPWDEEALLPSPGWATHDQGSRSRPPSRSPSPTCASSPRRVAQWVDPQRGRYVKIVSRAGVVQGFICLGMPRTGAELVLLFESGAQLPADQSVLFRLDGPEVSAGNESGAKTSPDSTICRCSGATLGTIEEAVQNGNCTIESLGQETRAGSGCGGCREKLTEIIANHFVRDEGADLGGSLEPV